MHTNSIQTEYYDEGDIPSATNFYQHSTHDASFSNNTKKQLSPSSSSGVALRIQQNIREYQQQIKKNKNTIQQLECQRKFFDKLSQKQKDKIDQIDLEKIRAEYETRIFHVKQQSAGLHEVIATLQEEQQQADDSYVETYTKITANKSFLMETLIQLEKQNEALAQNVDNSNSDLKDLELEIDLNQKTIKEKQAVHRKYVELQIQIERLQNLKKNFSPKKKV